LADAQPARPGAEIFVLARSPVRHLAPRLDQRPVRVTELVPKIKVSLPARFAYQQGFSILAGGLVKLPP